MNSNVEWVLKRPGYQRLLMLVAIIVLIAGLFVWMVFLPQVETYAKLQLTSAVKQVKLEKDRLRAANLPRFQAEYDKLLVQLDMALKELPNGRQIPELLTSISARAKGSGLYVQSFRPGKEKPIDFYAEVPVKLKFEGSFHQVANFFYSISTLPRIVNIKNVKIGSKSKGKSEDNILSVDCMAITFRFLDKPVAQKSAKRKKRK
jgi:type IV pilus assembly protein PilO